ncbi:hypothetical protein FRC06_007186 [Ceratobasidium sp. 370]|nr:hypothetical protein FRC06_007186 [Ceratobasidium sp. 370]
MLTDHHPANVLDSSRFHLPVADSERFGYRNPGPNGRLLRINRIRRSPTNNGWASPPPQGGNVSPLYADQSSASVGVARPPSTVYQPSSHLAYSPPASPPGSPPVPDVYGGMAASGSGGAGLPAGAAPPMNVYGPEKKSYVPYQ